jgi:hypothetical protein
MKCTVKNVNTYLSGAEIGPPKQKILQSEQRIKQESVLCDWCGKSVVLVTTNSEDGQPLSSRLFEFYSDYKRGPPGKDENDLLHVLGEHNCKVACSLCGVYVILDDGGVLYERTDPPTTLSSSSSKRPHKCNPA